MIRTAVSRIATTASTLMAPSAMILATIAQLASSRELPALKNQNARIVPSSLMARSVFLHAQATITTLTVSISSVMRKAPANLARSRLCKVMISICAKRNAPRDPSTTASLARQPAPQATTT